MDSPPMVVVKPGSNHDPHDGQRTLEPVCPASAEAANAQVALVALERQNFGAEWESVMQNQVDRDVLHQCP